MNQSVDYCPSCGEELITRQIEGRSRKYCSNCESPIYQNPKPCSGVLVTRDDSVLLIQRTNPPAVGSWSVPAGYLEHDEPSRIAAARELAEETNIHVDPDDPELLTTKFVPHSNGTYVLVVIYTVKQQKTMGQPQLGSDANAVHYWSLDELTTEAALEPGYREVFLSAIED